MFPFRIYYGDGSTYSGDPFEANPHNVTCVAVPGRLWHSKDAYYWAKDQGWVPCDDWGMRDYLLNYIGPKAVLFGRNMRDEDYWKILNRAMEEGIG